MSTATLPAVLSVYDVAEWLGTSRRRVLRMVRTKAIPYIQLPGGDVVFTASALAAWIEAQSAGGGHA
jgi:excisionase family DNA binding protein